jgi:integrase
MSILPDKKDGKLTGRWRVELQSQGHRVRKRFDTIEEARSYEKATKMALAKGVRPFESTPRGNSPKPEMALSDLRRAVEGHLWVGHSSERQAHQRLEGALRILGPSRTVDSITIEDTDRLVTVLRSQGAAPGTINRYLSALMTALKWASKRGHRKTPLPELQWQEEDEGRIRWITPAEEASVLALLPRAEALAVYIAIRTGLRRGELLELQQRDVEPLWVHLWGTGTKSGKGRSIPLTLDVFNALQEFFSLGKTTIEGLRYHWNTARDALGLSGDPDFVFHATRHTFATRAVQAGVHPRVLQRLMGHADLATTMRYMQVSDGMLASAIHQIADHGGGLQGGGIALDTPSGLAATSLKTLRHQEVK